MFLLSFRSVYLSGGVTMVPGFAERLQEELKKLAPPTVTIEVSGRSTVNLEIFARIKFSRIALKDVFAALKFCYVLNLLFVQWNTVTDLQIFTVY